MSPGLTIIGSPGKWRGQVWWQQHLVWEWLAEDKAAIRRAFSHWLNCRRKKLFLTERVANSVARSVRQLDGKNIQSYQCTNCGYWHNGHAH